MKNTSSIDRVRSPRIFKLGTTSFIFPDHILPNIKKIGRFVDEIELLVFESQGKNVLPSEKDIEQFARAAQAYNLTYNVHLPTDLYLAGRDKKTRKVAAETYLNVLTLFAPLSPSTCTLHIEMPEGITDKAFVRNAQEGLSRLLEKGVDAKGLSIETLDKSFFLIAPLIEAFDLPVCLDMGHAMKYGYDPAVLLENYQIPLIHLHGVDKHGKDHVALDHLDPDLLDSVIPLLFAYEGVVSLEVFNKDHLVHSMKVLDRFFRNIPKLSF